MHNLNSTNLYWFFEDGFTNEQCDYAINLGSNLKYNLGTIGTIGNRNIDKIPLNDKETKIIKKTRDSDVVFLDDQNIYQLLWKFLDTANKNSGWNYQIDFTEQVQLTRYKKNKFYDWHQDQWNKPYGDDVELGKQGKIRKLSMVVLLSDPKDFKGGNLQFYSPDPLVPTKNHILDCKELKKRGSLVVFPSYLWHRVKPVTKGIRYSLVAWNCGNLWT
jgi:PKHD-type hydroxylase